MRHPAAWHAYRIAHDGAYLTDQPIRPGCRRAPNGGLTVLHCPGAFGFPQRPEPGHVWIEVEVGHQRRDHRSHSRRRIDGYPVRVDASTGYSTLAGGFPTDSHGFPVPFCGSGTRYAFKVTGTAPTTSVQPAGFTITACFGTRTARARSAFHAMVRGARIWTGPSQTAPVAGAQHCVHRDLKLDYSEQGVSMSILSGYAFTDVGHVTCSLGGRPHLALLTDDGTVDHDVVFRQGGSGSPLYLRPGARVYATSQAYLNPDLHRPTHIYAVRVRLPGITRPFTHRLSRRDLVRYGHSPVVDVSPLEGN